MPFRGVSTSGISILITSYDVDDGVEHRILQIHDFYDYYVLKRIGEAKRIVLLFCVVMTPEMYGSYSVVLVSLKHDLYDVSITLVKVVKQKPIDVNVDGSIRCDATDVSNLYV